MNRSRARTSATPALLLLLTFAAGAPGRLQAADSQEMTKTVERMFQSSFSEEQYFRNDRLLVSATGSLLPVHKAPAVATILTAEGMEKMGARFLDEALESVPGLHVTANTLARLDRVYSIRGIQTPTNPQVLFLLNGVPIMHSYQGGRAPTFRMPVANIARVEVIRGPGSAVHGADAFAGTVNIITKDARDIDGSVVGARLGSFDTKDAWLQHGGVWGGWDISLSLAYQKSDGDPDRTIARDVQTHLDQGFGTHASRAPGALDTHYEILDAHLGVARGNWSAGLWGWVQNGAGLGDGATHVTDSESEEEVKQVLGELTYHNDTLLSDWDMNLRLSYVFIRDKVDFELFPPGSVLPVGADGNLFPATDPRFVLFTDGAWARLQGDDQQAGADLTLLYSGLASQRLRFGGGYRYVWQDEIHESKNYGPGAIDVTVPERDGQLTDVSDSAYAFIGEHTRRVSYLSVQDEWQIAKHWDLVAGARYDHYSDFGGTFNPRVALVWEPRYDLSAKLLYGRAFRPPSFAELYAKNNPATLGNSDLEPETIHTVELALDYQPTTSLRAILSVFYYRIKDLIAFVPDANSTTSTAQNTMNQHGYGFEVEAQWDIAKGLGLKTSVSYQKSQEEENEEPIPDAPAWRFYLNPHWEFLPHTSIDGRLNWVGGRRRAAGDSRARVDDYTLVDLTLRRKNLWKHLDLALAVRNLFNENAKEPAQAAIPGDYPLEGRSLWVEGALRF